MKSLRLLAGWLCVAVGFGLVIALGLGVSDPLTSAAATTSLVPVLVAHLPSVSFGIAVFALGLWLITTGKNSP